MTLAFAVAGACDIVTGLASNWTPAPADSRTVRGVPASTCRCTVTPACSFSCLAVAEMKSSSI